MTTIRPKVQRAPASTPTAAPARPTAAVPSAPARPDAFQPGGPTPPGNGVVDVVKTYFSNPTNVATAGLTATRAGLTGVKLALRGIPVVGNIVNAASALVSAARVAVTTTALVRGDKGVEKSDVVADWARLATDVGGIFFPPVGLAGTLGSTAYTIYDAVEDHRAAAGTPG